MQKEIGTVLLQPLGVNVLPKPGQSILDAALAAGVNLPRSCQSGMCGSCSARLLAGQVSYPLGKPLGLSAQDEREGKVLLCMARPVGSVVVEARPVTRAGLVQVKRLPCRVDSKCMVSRTVMRLVLRLPAVESLDFEPGQYVDLIFSSGRRRSLSIASQPGRGYLLELHVGLGLSGELTGQALDDLKPGSVLRLEGPFGNFTLQQSSRPWLMIAGEAGFAPFKSMLDLALSQGERRRIRFFWGVRDQRDLYGVDILEAYARDFADFRWIPVLSDADMDSDWAGQKGQVHKVVMTHTDDIRAYDIYVAGPPGMMDAVRREFPGAGANPAAMFFDSVDSALRSSGHDPGEIG